MHLSDADKQKLIALIQAGKPIPPVWKSRLFDSADEEFVEATKIYQLTYKGKTPKQNVLADTPPAPFQPVRTFNADNPFPDGWRNLLIYGDNLLALKTLYDDQRGPNIYGTRNKIKLIYIDPPFATKQDFMKDREKAYRDKVIGAQFIEFLRKRLIMLREILADDGSIYVHLDWKKVHYLKAVLDEIFGEENFRNDISWARASSHNDATARYGRVKDSILYYCKTDAAPLNIVYTPYSREYISAEWRRLPSGRWWKSENMLDPHSTMREYEFHGTLAHWRTNPEGMEKLWNAPQTEVPGSHGRIKLGKNGHPIRRCRIMFLDEMSGVPLPDVWTDIPYIAGGSTQSVDYPTQKPELLLERIIRVSSKEDDIVLDAFSGGGTTAAVAEKLHRRWIAMDCGKLAVYTTQRRLLELTTQIGTRGTESQFAHERVSDFVAHAKSSAQALVMISDKVRNGDLEVSDEFLNDLAKFLKKYTNRKSREFSLLCPKEKLNLTELKAEEPSEDDRAGEQIVSVDGIRFLVSFIAPKEKPEKAKLLKTHEFALLNAGVYDSDAIKAMPWTEYKPFVMRLFAVREESHKIHGFTADGYIGTDSAFVWNYPEQKKLIVDEEYVATLHKALGGRAGDRFYVIAPVVSMGFMMDEIAHGETTYVFLKVPISILRRLLESEEHGALKQPISEADVNEVIDAVGFDFVSQPVVKTQCRRAKPEKEDLLNRHQKDYVIRLKEFRSHTLATDPEDFQNFETLSMILVDTDFQGGIFRLGKVFWAEDLVKSELTRQETTSNGTFTEQAALCKQLEIRIPEPDFTGKKIMVIFIDKYGNEKKGQFQKADFA